MLRKVSVTALVLVVLMPIVVSPKVAYAATPMDELVVDKSVGSGPVTLDPAAAFDTDSAELLSSVYDTLIQLDGERYDVFIPGLAEQVWIGPRDPDAPEYVLFTIYFKIRDGVNFHTWSRSDLGTLTWEEYTLTPEDVEHTFERMMVYDYPSGQQWMLYEHLLGVHHADPTWPSDPSNPINLAVRSNLSTTWFEIWEDTLPGENISFAWFVKLFDEAGRQIKNAWDHVENAITGVSGAVKDLIVDFIKRFLKAISSPFCSILSKRWLLEVVDPMAEAAGHPVGEWPGTWENWTLYHYPTSPLVDAETPPPIDIIPDVADPGLTCGTGPYILDWLQWSYGWSLVKYDDYWRGWPADWPSPPYPSEVSSGIRPAGWVERLTVRQRSTSTGIAELLSGDADFAYVPRARAGDLHVDGDRNGPTKEGIRLDFPIPSLSVNSFHMTFDVEPTLDNRYGEIYDTNVLNPNGIPRNFFSNINVRKAFAHLINFTMIIQDLLLGEAYQPNTFAPSGLPYVNLTIPKYNYDPDKAAYYFDQAYFGGRKLTDVGFTVYIAYESGNEECKRIAEHIVNSLIIMAAGKGWPFHAQIVGKPRRELLKDIFAHKVGIYVYKWKPDPVNIHDYAFTYAHSSGPLASAQRYWNPLMDELIEIGLRKTSNEEKMAIYTEIENIFYEEVPTVPLYVAIERVYMRDWVQGYYYNPTYPGIYAYNLWKWPMTTTAGAEGYFVGDVNFDGKVSMDDIIAIVDSFGSYSGKQGTLVFHPKWNFYCDVDDSPMYRWRDRKIDMGDIVNAIANFGKTSIPWQQPPP